MLSKGCLSMWGSEFGDHLMRVHLGPPGNEAFVSVRLRSLQLPAPFRCREAVGKEIGVAGGSGKGQSGSWGGSCLEKNGHVGPKGVTSPRVRLDPELGGRQYLQWLTFYIY